VIWGEKTVLTNPYGRPSWGVEAFDNNVEQSQARSARDVTKSPRRKKPVYLFPKTVKLPRSLKSALCGWVWLRESSAGDLHRQLSKPTMFFISTGVLPSLPSPSDDIILRQLHHIRVEADHRITENHRMVGVGRDLCGSSSPTVLPKQGHL